MEERLDKDLENSYWIVNFPNVKLFNLIASHSYYNLILLQCGPSQRTNNKYSFKFESKWLKEGEIYNIVMYGWMQGENIDVMQHITSCGVELERWNKMKWRKTKVEVAGCLEKMELCHNSHELGSVVMFLKVQREYNRVFIQEDTF